MVQGYLRRCQLIQPLKATKSPSLHAFIHDAKRFALYNRSMIEEAPLQIYCSALVFAPERSIVRGHFKNQIPHWIRGLPKVHIDWSSLEQTLEGHSDWVTSVVFSPDGSKVASGSDDRTVRIWNVATGQAEQTLEGHSGSVTSVVFSPDGSKVASGSPDGTVRIWNVATGQAEQTLEGVSSSVTSVVFSPDSSKSHSFYSMDSSGVWVTQNGLRILYLPFDFRPNRYSTDHLATKGNTLAIGACTGRVAIVIFHSDVKEKTI